MDLAVDTTPNRGRGRPKGSKNKVKNVVSLDGFDSGDLTWGDYPPLPEQPAEKRGRGRPKGSKNKPGHKAGRPRKSGTDLETGDEDEDHASTGESTHFKRARTAELSSLASLNASHVHNQLQHAQQSHSLHNPQDRHDSHALAGDIPVDPSLMGAPHQSNTSSANSIAGPSRGIELSRYSQSDFGLGVPVSAPSPLAVETASAAIAYFSRDIAAPASKSVPQHVHRPPEPTPPPPPPTSQHAHHPYLHSSHQLSAHQTALNSLSGALSSKPDVKGKGTLHTTITPISAEVGVSGVIRSLLPKDLLGSLPQVSGPFQLVETEDRKRKLDGPLAASSLDRQPGPVYVYIANYQPSESASAGAPPPVVAPQTPGGIPVGLASWKITHPLTSEGKDRQRGPRKCGHCGKYECRGRGGRTWCPDYRAGLPGVPPTKRNRSSTTASGMAKTEGARDDEEDEGDDDDDDEGTSSLGDMQQGTTSLYQPHSSAGDGHASYSALANFRGDVQQSNDGNVHASGSHTFQTGQRNVADGDTDADVHDSVLSLIQSILPQTSGSDGRSFAADFITSTGYRDPGAPLNSYESSGMELYGSASAEPELSLVDAGEESAVAGGSSKKPRAPRTCATCKSSSCPGKTQRKRCKDWRGDEAT